MLEVLVGKTIEQALLEVMEEEELARIWSHQYAFQELRNAELAEVQRLEEQERRHREEKVETKQMRGGGLDPVPELQSSLKHLRRREDGKDYNSVEEHLLGRQKIPCPILSISS